MGFAVLFSGQGMQHPAMLPWLAPDDPLGGAVQRLGAPDWRQRLADPAWAAGNRQAQLLLTGSALSVWAQLAPGLPAPLAVAGYSVGELAAFSAAGVMDTGTALALAEQRAQAMDACADAVPGGLSGVTGLLWPQVQALCERCGVAVAIHNGADSVVLGGPLDALARAEAQAEALGAHCTRLRVSVASHTPWMHAASEAFAQVLAALPLARPRGALFGNASGARLASAGAVREALAEQIQRTVRWSSCMEAIHARQVRCVLEVGPGAALARLWNQQHPAVPARSCDEFRSAEAVQRWVHAHLD